MAFLVFWIWGAATPRTLRPVWAACELGLDFEHRPIGSRTGETQSEEYTSLNPGQKIPILEDDDQQGLAHFVDMLRHSFIGIKLYSIKTRCESNRAGTNIAIE